MVITPCSARGVLGWCTPNAYNAECETLNTSHPQWSPEWLRSRKGRTTNLFSASWGRARGWCPRWSHFHSAWNGGHIQVRRIKTRAKNKLVELLFGVWDATIAVNCCDRHFCRSTVGCVWFETTQLCGNSHQWERRVHSALREELELRHSVGFMINKHSH